MDELQAEGEGFDAKCKVLIAIGGLALVAGLALTLTTRFIPVYYILYAVGLIVGIVAWMVCLRETTLVGQNEDAPEEVRPDDAPEETEK